MRLRNIMLVLLAVLVIVGYVAFTAHAQTVVTGAWPSKVAEVHLTGKNAAITYTTIPGSIVAGATYRVTAVARMTGAGSAGTLVMNVGANNWNASNAGNNAVMTSANSSSSVIATYKPTAAPYLQYKVDNTGASGAYTYDVDILVERIF